MFINYAFNTEARIYTIKLWYSGTFMYVSCCVLCVHASYVINSVIRKFGVGEERGVSVKNGVCVQYVYVRM